MTWYAVCRVADGDLVSLANALPKDLPAHLEAIDLKVTDQPNGEKVLWDPGTKAFIQRPDTPAPSRTLSVSQATLDSDLGKMLKRVLELQGVTVTAG